MQLGDGVLELRKSPLCANVVHEQSSGGGFGGRSPQKLKLFGHLGHVACSMAKLAQW